MAYAQSATFSSQCWNVLLLWLNCCCLWSVRPANRYTEEEPPKQSRTRVCALANSGQQAVFSLARTARKEASQKLSQPKLSFSVFRTHATICCFTTTTTTTRLTSSKYFQHLFLEKIFEFSSTFFSRSLSLPLCCCSLSIWPSQICL